MNTTEESHKKAYYLSKEISTKRVTLTVTNIQNISLKAILKLVFIILVLFQVIFDNDQMNLTCQTELDTRTLLVVPTDCSGKSLLIPPPKKKSRVSFAEQDGRPYFSRTCKTNQLHMTAPCPAPRDGAVLQVYHVKERKAILPCKNAPALNIFM